MTVNWQEVWQKRYAEEGYVYGKKPNVFFKQVLDSLPVGKVFIPAEGSGRNAIYAAKKGWEVTSLDYVESAKEQALAFAKQENVEITYHVSPVLDFSYPTETYDLIAVIYMHLTEVEMKSFIEKAHKALNKNGLFILEAFTKEQLGKPSGGPKSLDLLYDLEVLKTLLADFKIEQAETLTTTLDEGKYHQGFAEIVRVIAIKI